MGKRLTVFLTIVGFMLAIGIGTASSEEAIKVGASVPITGPYATTGQTMLHAVQMAADDYNAQGGLVGRKIEVIVGDVGDTSAENVKAVAERLIAAGSNMVITGWDSLTDAAVKAYAPYDVPYLAGPAEVVYSDTIEAGMPETNNVFEYCWDELTYAHTLMVELFRIPKKINWTPPNKNIAVLRVDIPYTMLPSNKFMEMAKAAGYKVVIDEISQFGRVDWGTMLTKIERAKPSYIILMLLDPTDTARFQIQFHEKFAKKGFPAIIVSQYSPSVPEYMTLTGKDISHGVIYMGGAIRFWEPKVGEYVKRWEARYNEKPFDIYAVLTRDGFDIWGQAVRRAGCVECYDEVNRLIRESPYEGMWGTYVFGPHDQTAIYGEYLLPVDWLQIRNGEHLQVYPDRYKVADYEKPPWIKD
jgi:branched-chain amino acid transport system substrate-binding protein